MSIQSEINRISGNVSDALDAISAKGVTVPVGSNSDDLASLIAQIQGGGGVVITDTLDSHGGTIRTITAAAYPDGDTEGFGTPGLAGTTWYFSSPLNFTDFVGNPTAFNVNFTANSNNYTSLGISASSASSGSVTYGATTVYNIVGWSGSSYRTVSFTGGSDAKSAALIAWVEANATQQ